MGDEAKTPEELARDILRADTIKLNFGGEVYQLTEVEKEWIAMALQGINPNKSQRDT